MIKVKEVKALSAHRLSLRFSDGTNGVADLTAMLRENSWGKKVSKPKVFATASVDLGAVEWEGTGVGIAQAILYAMVHGLKRPESFEDASDNELAVSLKELRKIAGASQTSVSATMGMDQSQLSRFERSDDRMVSTLRRYVKALGGELEVVAVIGDKRVTLRGV